MAHIEYSIDLRTGKIKNNSATDHTDKNENNHRNNHKNKNNNNKKKRYGLLAVLMHLSAPGLGFLYTGQYWIALITPFILFLFVFVLAWNRLILEPWGLLLIWGGLLAFYVLLIPVVLWMAKKNNPCRLNHGQHWLVYLIFTLVLGLLVTTTLYFRAFLFGYETFVLPSRSMANTLLPGDYIIVDTWAYSQAKPRRGDILVFKYPKNPEKFFTKRLIAIPGDVVSMSKGRVSVNNKWMTEAYVLPANNKITSKKIYEMGKVPEGYYFMLGDNRDHSNDSRSWGFLEKEAVYGKAASIWFSFSSKEGIRLKRIKKLGNFQEN